MIHNTLVNSKNMYFTKRALWFATNNIMPLKVAVKQIDNGDTSCEHIKNNSNTYCMGSSVT